MIDYDPFHAQCPIMVGLNFADIIHQGIESTPREVVAVEGNQAGIGSDQCRTGIKIHSWRGVDEDIVECLEGIQRLPQFVHLVAGFQLDLQFFQSRIGWHHAEVGKGRRDDVGIWLIRK